MISKHLDLKPSGVVVQSPEDEVKTTISVLLNRSSLCNSQSGRAGVPLFECLSLSFTFCLSVLRSLKYEIRCNLHVSLF